MNQPTKLVPMAQAQALSTCWYVYVALSHSGSPNRTPQDRPPKGSNNVKYAVKMQTKTAAQLNSAALQQGGGD